MISTESKYTKDLEEITFKLLNQKHRPRVNRMYVEGEYKVQTPQEYFETMLKPNFTDKCNVGQFLEDITYILQKGKKLYLKAHEDGGIQS